MKKVQKKLPATPSNSYLVDTHCHLDMDAYGRDLDAVLDRSYRHNIRYVVTIGTNLSSSRKAVEIAKHYEMVFAAIGIHPHDVDNIKKTTFLRLQELAETAPPHIVGYGEIGLDYVKKYSSVHQQRKQFKNQLSLAKELDLPVIIHNREADDDMLSLLCEAAPFNRGGVMHCFSGDVPFAQKILDLGLHISIPGIVTYKNAHTLKDVVREIPLTSLLLETDGPFLTPTPHRGKRNEPLFILYTATEIARIRQLSLEKVAKQTTQNAIHLFGLPAIKEMESK